MVQLDLTADFRCQFLQCDGDNVHRKERINFLGQSDITNREICKLVMQTSESASTQEATELMVKILIYSQELVFLPP